MTRFAQRFIALSEARSPLCLGVDPSIELLDQWGLARNASGLAAFCDILMEAMGEQVAIVKPQSAFFEQFGPDGMRELARVVKMIQARGALALIDVKRGDIGHTLDAYADAMIGPDSPVGGDAMTVLAYLGFGSLAPLLRKAVERQSGVFVVVRSSNPEGRPLQDARLGDGRTVATALADDITAFNRSTGAETGPVGPLSDSRFPVRRLLGGPSDPPNPGGLPGPSGSRDGSPKLLRRGAPTVLRPGRLR